MNALVHPLDVANKAQGEAADPGASVFVTANAGSGKTKVLVDRIARLLLGGSPPAAFLCITYTKAAAAEMQRRLFERLGTWCVADDATLAAELTKLGAPPTKPGDLSVARGLFARALETPGGLRIQTIHAFCERLLARFPLEANVAPGFDIADEQRAAALLMLARRRAVLDVDETNPAAFARFAARLHGEGLEALLDRLVLRRAEFKRFAQTHRDPVAAIRARHGVSATAEVFISAQLERVNWKDVRLAAQVLGGSSKRDQQLGERFEAAIKTYDEDRDRDALMAYIRVAINKDGEPYKCAVTNKLSDEHSWLPPLCEDIIAHAQAVLEGLNAIDRAEDAEAALALTLKLDAAYEAAKTRFGALDFEDLITHAQLLLSRAEAAPWVLYKLDGGLDHILIDEGQDTSPGQWDLIAPLQQEFFAGSGARNVLRTMFAVGDPKQSIYAFQGADPDRFLREAQTLRSHAYEADRLFVEPRLETSFRTVPEILRAVDATFEGFAIMPGAPKGANHVQHFASREKESGVVEVWPLARRPERVEAMPWDAPLDVETETSAPAMLSKAIAKQVKAWIDQREGVWDKGVLRPMRPGDVMALVRTRGALFRELIKAFKRAGLPVAGPDRMVLKEELAVEDCLALIRVALDPADDLSLACVLKGPWCDFDDDDADIFPLAHGRAKFETLFDRLMASADPKYATAKAFMTEIVARAGLDAFDFLSWALETITPDGRSGWARLLARLGGEARDPLEELLSRALSPSPYTAPSLQRFLADIEADAGQVKRELDAAGSVVRVMTVHGAKGLEAPVVILPDCTAAVADRAEDGLLFSEEGPFLSPSEKYDDAATRRARDAHKERATGEHLRLLYVAMTRARDRLIVCGAQYGTSKLGEAPESWRLMAEAAMTRLGATACDTPFGQGMRIGEPKRAEPEQRATRDLVALPAWARTPIATAIVPAPAAPSRLKRLDPAVFSPRGDGQARFRRGRLIHGLLERLPDIAHARRQDAALAWLERQGAQTEEARALAAEALAVIDDPGFSSVFGPSSRAEIPIVGEVANRPVRGVVDRLAIDHDRVLVLDFKTDRPAPKTAEETPQAYRLQMALYRAVIAKIFPGTPIRCALLWTEAPRLIELETSLLDAALEEFRGS